MINNTKKIMKENIKYLLLIFTGLVIYTISFSFYSIINLNGGLDKENDLGKLLQNEGIVTVENGWIRKGTLLLENNNMNINISSIAGAGEVSLKLGDITNKDISNLTGIDVSNYIDDNYVNMALKFWWETGYLVKFIVWTVLLCIVLQFIRSGSKRVLPVFATKMLHRDKKEMPIGALDAMNYLYKTKVEDKKFNIVTMLYALGMTIYGLGIEGISFIGVYVGLLILVLSVNQITLYMELSEEMK